jgi:hypothetical protein
MRRTVTLLAVITILLLANRAAASDQKSARQSLVGTWKLNVTKSSWGTIPAPKESTLVVLQDDAKGLKWTGSGVSADGDSFSFSFEGTVDGKDYPIKSASNEDVSGFTRAYSDVKGVLQAVDKKNGSVVQTSTTTVSDDGHAMTIKFVSSDGASTWTEVLDRVK